MRIVLAMVCLLAGCAGSVLPRAEDPAYREAVGHLARTASAVGKMKAPDQEKAQFLQGESLYRYRFTAPPENAGRFAAEAAAAITDFPAFQSLAGSLDLMDLRYRAPDAAIQLWETLLEDHPDTLLRPLTLYRLGWAYRSAGVVGLPRKEPDDAFDQLIAERPGSQLALLAQQAKRVPWKSKSTALSRSIVPGLGQLYLGERRRGLTRLGVALLSLAAVAAPAYSAARRSSNLSWKSDWPLLATGVAGLVVLSYDYTDSYEDAQAGVVLWNERAEAEFERQHPDAP